MRKDVLPHLGSLALGSIDTDEITKVLNRIVQRGSVRQAGCVLSDMRQMFRWALKEGWIDDDPTSTLSKVALCGTQQRRVRTLSHAEIKELAQRMDSAGLARHIRRATWLMLATGARIGELAAARWRDIDVAARLWTIPAEFSHSGHSHLVPLSDFALSHLQPDGGARHGSDWVFPGRNAEESLSPKALGKQIRDRQRGIQIRGRSAATKELLLSGGAWTPLDLRRTAAAMMRDLHIAPETIAACLDHGVGTSGASGPATDHETLTKCRDAFDQLGLWLVSIERPQPVSDRLAA
jgi:integrase